MLDGGVQATADLILGSARNLGRNGIQDSQEYSAALVSWSYWQTENRILIRDTYSTGVPAPTSGQITATVYQKFFPSPATIHKMQHGSCRCSGSCKESQPDAHSKHAGAGDQKTGEEAVRVSMALDR